ncbi:MAG: hypothetical protein ACM3NH_03725 [Candidatus Saccharibacteria bacterium]
MDNEREIEARLAQYRALADKDKNIDVAGLMVSLLENQNANLLPQNQKRWAYLVSLALPPFGLLFALRFYVSGKDDGKQAAYICIGLTIASIFLIWITASLMLSGSGVDTSQIQQIKPQDIQELVQ